MSACSWEEIHGFESPSEYQIFVRYIDGQVEAGHVCEVAPSLDYHKDFVFGGRWFQDVDSAEIWRLVLPDFPFRGVWEPVATNRASPR
jgi:hypothetical protein